MSAEHKVLFTLHGQKFPDSDVTAYLSSFAIMRSLHVEAEEAEPNPAMLEEAVRLIQ